MADAKDVGAAAESGASIDADLAAATLDAAVGGHAAHGSEPHSHSGVRASFAAGLAAAPWRREAGFLFASAALALVGMLVWATCDLADATAAGARGLCLLVALVLATHAAATAVDAAAFSVFQAVASVSPALSYYYWFAASFRGVAANAAAAAAGVAAAGRLLGGGDPRLAGTHDVALKAAVTGLILSLAVGVRSLGLKLLLTEALRASFAITLRDVLRAKFAARCLTAPVVTAAGRPPEAAASHTWKALSQGDFRAQLARLMYGAVFRLYDGGGRLVVVTSEAQARALAADAYRRLAAARVAAAETQPEQPAALHHPVGGAGGWKWGRARAASSSSSSSDAPLVAAAGSSDRPELEVVAILPSGLGGGGGAPTTDPGSGSGAATGYGASKGAPPPPAVRLPASLSSSLRPLTAADFIATTGAGDAATAELGRWAFDAADANEDGAVSSSELADWVADAYWGWANLRKQLEGHTTGLRVLGRVLNGAFWMTVGLVALVVMGVELGAVLVPLGTVVVAASFAVGPVTGDAMQGLMLVLVTKPFDVGDKVRAVGAWGGSVGCGVRAPPASPAHLRFCDASFAHAVPADHHWRARRVRPPRALARVPRGGAGRTDRDAAVARRPRDDAAVQGAVRHERHKPEPRGAAHADAGAGRGRRVRHARVPGGAAGGAGGLRRGPAAGVEAGRHADAQVVAAGGGCGAGGGPAAGTGLG